MKKIIEVMLTGEETSFTFENKFKFLCNSRTDIFDIRTLIFELENIHSFDKYHIKTVFKYFRENQDIPDCYEYVCSFRGCDHLYMTVVRPI